MSQILVFGASIVYGAWDREGGWVSRLRKAIDEKNLTGSDFSGKDFYWLVYNLGIDGNNTKDLLKRFEPEIKARLWPGEETIIIISAGVNDSLYDNKKKTFAVPPDKYEQNLQKLLVIAKKYTSKIIFIGSSPVDDSRTNPAPWTENCSYLQKYIKAYDNIAKSICKKNKIPFVDVRDELDNDVLEDGVHPNSEGHEIIFKNVWPVLERFL